MRQDAIMMASAAPISSVMNLGGGMASLARGHGHSASPGVGGHSSGIGGQGVVPAVLGMHQLATGSVSSQGGHPAVGLGSNIAGGGGGGTITLTQGASGSSGGGMALPSTPLTSSGGVILADPTPMEEEDDTSALTTQELQVLSELDRY